MLRHMALAAVAGIACAVPVGCYKQSCCGEPLLRQDQLLEKSEDIRDLGDKWYRGCDHPVELPNDVTPVRIHGGIQ